jgi:hypothetical protein
MVFKPRARIKVNSLLRGTEQTITLEELAILRLASPNLLEVTDDLVSQIDSAYGSNGLFQLGLLASAHKEGEFRHFFDVIKDWVVFRALIPEEQTEFQLDNDKLPQSPRLERYNTNLVQPSLSRKLYRAGRHHGSLVYGFGGPRILISHPFRGSTRDIYDVYNNSLDVVTSLYLRGIEGTFHFLDNLPGLNFDVDGVPAWLIWFSVIAAHSDIVLFIKEYEEDFGLAQQREIEFTPDRIQKKVIEIPHSELKWAKEAEVTGAPYMYIGKSGAMTEEEWFEMEAEHARPFIENYVAPIPGLPKDKLVQINEDGVPLMYPQDYPVYVYADGPGG